MEAMEMEDTRILRSHAGSEHTQLFSTRTLKALVSALAFMLTVKLLWSFSFQTHLPATIPNSFYLQRGAFEQISLSGFANTGNPGIPSCEDIKHNGVVQVQQSFTLDDDLLQVANELENHPMVNYTGQDRGLTPKQMLQKCWSRSSESSIWLDKYEVFLAISQISFSATGSRLSPTISFIRGQIYDKNWVEMKNYTIEWQGDQITFPVIFDIPVPYQMGDGFFGPQRPRVVVEDEFEDVEPVIVFNLRVDLENPVQAVYVFRPFTNDLTSLTINGQKIRATAEHGMAPFFYDSTAAPITGRKWANKHLHFVQGLQPFQVLQCHLLNGYCEMVYELDDLDPKSETYGGLDGIVFGTTNLYRIPTSSIKGTVAYIGFAQTQIEAGCSTGPTSRPAMMVVTASEPSRFHVDFVSDLIDFEAVAPYTADLCSAKDGSIITGISQWDRSGMQDVLTINSISSDSTARVLRINGLLDYLKNLPYLLLSLQNQNENAKQQALWDFRWSTAGNDVIGCSIAAAHDHVLDKIAPGQTTNS